MLLLFAYHFCHYHYCPCHILNHSYCLSAMAEENLYFQKSTQAPFPTDHNGKELLIIDCDAGTDDAMAILLALCPKMVSHVQVLGISCVGGNSTLDNVVKNVLRTLKVANQEEIPVLKGAVTGVISRDLVNPSGVHGSDGLGGMAHTVPISQEKIDQVLQRENAVDWLGRTILRYPPGSITLITLGPMTNLAFAHRLFPDIHSRLKRLVVMGGGLNARGNMGLTSEFNFDCDPEAAHCILAEFICPITVVPFDTCVLHCFAHDWYEATLQKTNSIKSKFIGDIFRNKADYIKGVYKGNKGFYACDWIAMLCALDSVTRTIQETVHHYGSVELSGQMTRGQFVIDWRDSMAMNEKRKLEIVTGMNMEKVHEWFVETIL